MNRSRFAAQLAERRGQTLGAFGALLELRLGVAPMPLEHAVPGRPETTLLDACEDDADTIVDFAAPDFGFFFESGCL